MSKTQFYIIPKETIDNLIDGVMTGIEENKECPMSEKSIELGAVLATLIFIKENHILENE